MKNMNMKVAGIIILAMLMVTGMNAQPRQGRGQGAGPCNAACPWNFQSFRGGNGPGGTDRPFAALDLTEEQQEQLNALHLEHYKEMKPLRNQMAELRLKKRNLMSEDNADLKAINKVIDEQTALSNKIQKMMAENQLETKKIMTEEQLMKLDQMRALGKAGRGPRGNGYAFHSGPGFHGKGPRWGNGEFRGPGLGPAEVAPE